MKKQREIYDEDIISLKNRISQLETELDLLKKAEALKKKDHFDLSVLLKISIDSLETVEKRKVLQVILDGAVQLIGLDTGALYLINGDDIYNEASVPPLPENFPEEFKLAKLSNHAHISEAVTTKKPVLINDIDTVQLTEQENIILKNRNMHSLLFIPLFAMQNVTGVMILGTIGRKFEFSKREVDLCHTLSNIGSLSLENSLLFEQLNNNIKELRTAISVKELAEKKFRLLNRAVEQSPVSIVVTDHLGNIEYVNPKFTELTGYTLNEALGKTPRILNSGHHPQSFFEALWRTISSGSDWLGELKNKKKNGEFYWENVLISPMTDEHGKITHYVGVKEDITEKKAMIGNLLSAKEKAEESDRLKTAFLNNISHEIRTPLNAIVGFSTFLNDPDLSKEKRQQYTDIIIASNDQLLYIIDEIMKISHLEAGQVLLRESNTDICKLVRTLYSQYQPAIEHKKLGFVLDIDSIPEGTRIRTDEGKVRQILSNLLDNAVKFTPSGQIMFGCRKNDDYFEFFVEDTGVGIPEEEHKKIFQRFYQVSRPKAEIYSGTGLGLSICSGYATLLGGTLTVDSVPGKGSLFTLSLPAGESPED